MVLLLIQRALLMLRLLHPSMPQQPAQAGKVASRISWCMSNECMCTTSCRRLFAASRLRCDFFLFFGAICGASSSRKVATESGGARATNARDSPFRGSYGQSVGFRRSLSLLSFVPSATAESDRWPKAIRPQIAASAL